MAKAFAVSALCVVGLIVLAGCTQDVIVGRYSSAICESPGANAVPCHDVVPVADVAVVTIPTPTSTSSAAAATGSAAAAPSVAPPTPLVSATNFPDRALEEYIKVLSNPKFGSDAESLRQNIAAALKAAPTSAATFDDQTVLHRTMIVTVAKSALKFNPADRIEATDVFIQPVCQSQEGDPEEVCDAAFTSWDTAVTQFTTINAGTIQLTQARNTGQSLTVGAPPGAPITGSLGLTASQADTRAENFNATSQVDNLTVSVDGDGNIRVRRQGGIGIDLTGNTIIKVDLTVPPQHSVFKTLYSISGDYQDKTQNWGPPNKLSLKANIVYVPSKADPIRAKVTLTYTMRHIVSGDETLEEKDDAVRELTIVNNPVTFILVPGRQVSPPSYAIYANDQKDAPPLYVARTTSSRIGPLCFASYQAAEDLLAYVQHGIPTHPDLLGTATLGFSSLTSNTVTPLTPHDVDTLTVGPDCP